MNAFRYSGNAMEGERDMFDPQVGEKALRFIPSLDGGDALSGEMKLSAFSPYKLAMFAHDLVTVCLAFALGAWIGGLSFSGALLALSLIIITFFPTYSLYSYHIIFSQKEHLLNLLKSFGWSLLTYGIVALLYSWPHLFEDNALIPVVFLIAVGLMLLSRFMSDQLLNVLKSIGISFLAIGMIGLMIGDEKPITMADWPAILMSLSVTVGTVLVSRQFLVHVVFNIWMRRRFRRQVAIVGSDEEARKISSHIIDQNAPYWVAGIIGGQEVNKLDISVPKYRIGELKDLPAIVEKMGIDEIILTDENIDKRTFISLLDYCTSEGLTVWFPPKLMPIITTKLYIDAFCGLPMIRLCSQKNNWVFNKIKHGLDALIALPVCVLLLPLFLMIGAAIKLSSKGPVFYRTKAVGKNGEFFTMYKFRSMKVDNTSEIHKEFVTKLIKGQIGNEDKKDQPLKIADDPRVTSFGKFLRNYSVDELPQLINVLKGDMSLVGPRPCLPYEYELYEDWYKRRSCVRPGITGLWQVAGRSSVAFEDMILLDLYYIYNRSVLMDMNTLYETIFAVLEKRGAH